MTQIQIRTEYNLEIMKAKCRFHLEMKIVWRALYQSNQKLKSEGNTNMSLMSPQHMFLAALREVEGWFYNFSSTESPRWIAMV